MKLLLAFKSFMPRRLIAEIGSENWFAAGCPIRQRKLFRCRQPVRQRQLFRCRQPVRQRELVRCRLPNSAAKTVSLHNTQLGSECQFAAEDSVSAANHKFAADNSVSTANHSFGSESQFRCTTHNSAANANSLQKTQFRQRMLIRCS